MFTSNKTNTRCTFDFCLWGMLLYTFSWIQVSNTAPLTMQ